jgi:hypothetical protein
MERIASAQRWCGGPEVTLGSAELFRGEKSSENWDPPRLVQELRRYVMQAQTIQVPGSGPRLW